MIAKFIGGTLIIIGTCIGAGMLALPIISATGGIGPVLIAFTLCWFVTLIAALNLLESNMWFPEKANFVSMARATLGRPAEIVTWISYLFLLYGLITVYSIAGAELLKNLFALINISLPELAYTFIFMVFLGISVHKGVYYVDIANRFFMTLKMSSFFLLLIIILPFLNLSKVPTGSFDFMSKSGVAVFTAFTYSIVVPTLRYYFNSDVSQVKKTIYLGSIAGLLIYTAWALAIHCAVPIDELIKMTASKQAVADLTNALSQISQTPLIGSIAHFFTMICVTSSFLGASICLWDFLADGTRSINLKVPQLGITALTFIPPMLIASIFYQKFLLVFNYASIFAVYIMVVLPPLFVISGRLFKPELITDSSKIARTPLIFSFITLIVATITIAVAIYQLS